MIMMVTTMMQTMRDMMAMVMMLKMAMVIGLFFL